MQILENEGLDNTLKKLTIVATGEQLKGPP